MLLPTLWVMKPTKNSHFADLAQIIMSDNQLKDGLFW